MSRRQWFSLRYMLTIRLDVEDLASVRFAYSPMQEAAFSLPAWIPGHRAAVYRPWLSATAIGLDDVDWPLLLALRGQRGWLPDFLTPWPRTARPDLQTELDDIRATPDELVLHDLHGSHGDELPAPIVELSTRPGELAARIADAFAGYWRAVMASRWLRMTAILEADITYRSHRIATGGAAALFKDLDPRIRWEGGLVLFDESRLDADVEVSGRGLPLMPSIFPSGVTAVIDPGQPPILTYPARGRGTLTIEPDAAPEGLAALLGRTRAALLAGLEEPASTSHLAELYRLTPGAVSQHLGVLAANGLLTRSRSGHRVLYWRTALADRLVDGAR